MYPRFFFPIQVPFLVFLARRPTMIVEPFITARLPGRVGTHRAMCFLPAPIRWRNFHSYHQGCILPASGVPDHFRNAWQCPRTHDPSCERVMSQCHIITAEVIVVPGPPSSVTPGGDHTRSAANCGVIPTYAECGAGLWAPGARWGANCCKFLTIYKLMEYLMEMIPNFPSGRPYICEHLVYR